MTKTKEQLQAAVDEIRAVCKKHDIVIFGTCDSEDIYGEITIAEATHSGPLAGLWARLSDRLTNKVGLVDDEYKVNGIGDLQSNETYNTEDA